MSTAGPVHAGMPLLEQGIESVNFFNGRLVTSRDLSRDQDARREADARLGQAIGGGVVRGLDVQCHGGAADRRLQIRAGLAINRVGQTLCLGADQVLALVPPADPQAPASTGGFGPCRQLSGGAYVAGDGLYLVTLAPAAAAVGRAPVLALEPGNIRCNTDATVEAVQLRLLRIEHEVLDMHDLDPNAIGEPAQSRLRSAVAAACFGLDALGRAHQRPGVPAAPALLDTLRGRGLTDCDVPLAVVYLTTSQHLVFVDRWAVRRRVAADPASPAWSAWVGEPLETLAEAQLAQFQEHLSELPAGSLAGLRAADWFTWLPAAGFLDAAGSRAIDWQAFLGSRRPARSVPLASGDARAVLTQSLRHDAVPIASGTTPRFRVYRIDGGPWLFMREAPNAPHAEEVWLDGERAHLPGVHDVQSAIDALRAHSCQQLVLWDGADAHALLGRVAPGEDLNLCVEAGVHTLDRPLVLTGLGHVVIHGAGAGSLLRCNGHESALRVEACQSLTISDLGLRAGAVGSGRDGDVLGLRGALTVIETPFVQLDRVSARCGGLAGRLGAAAIVVSFSPPEGRPERGLHVTHCSLTVGEGQIGLLCVNCEQAFVRENTVLAANLLRPMQRGIVIAGEVAREVHVEGNVLTSVAAGIAVGLSQKEEERGEPLQAERVVVANNRVRVFVRDTRRDRFGIFVGNASSVFVQANRVTVEDDERAPDMEAVRLDGAYGPHVVVRDNHLAGAARGIRFTARPPTPEGRDQCLWIFEGNLAEGTDSVVVSDNATLLRLRNNIGLP